MEDDNNVIFEKWWNDKDNIGVDEKYFNESARLYEINEEIKERSKVTEDSRPSDAYIDALLRVLLEERDAIGKFLSGESDSPSAWNEELPVIFQCNEEKIISKCSDDDTADNKDGRKIYPLGGRPKSALREAVEMAYNNLLSSGNLEIIKTGKLTRFLEYLKDCISEGNPNFSEYIAKRIKEVKNPKGKCHIVMQDCTDKLKLYLANNRKNYVYHKQRVSAILTELRKK